MRVVTSQQKLLPLRWKLRKAKCPWLMMSTLGLRPLWNRWPNYLLSLRREEPLLLLTLQWVYARGADCSQQSDMIGFSYRSQMVTGKNRPPFFLCIRVPYCYSFVCDITPGCFCTLILKIHLNIVHYKFYPTSSSFLIVPIISIPRVYLMVLLLWWFQVRMLWRNTSSLLWPELWPITCQAVTQALWE